jgi:biopolymer transport protein ExbD
MKGVIKNVRLADIKLSKVIRMKRIVLAWLILFFVVYPVLSEGMAESFNNSQEEADKNGSFALIKRQKRVKWDGKLPDNIEFYECYILKTEYEEFLLLDASIKTTKKSNKNSLEINMENSRPIFCDDSNIKLENINKPYKCVVLYSTAIMGKALLYLINAKPVNDEVNYVTPVYQLEYD